jgi:hypothetical protein
MAAGVPDKPNEFYFVGAGSGVWKTENAGRTWTSLGNDLGASAMGAIAIAPSDPNVIYIGSGQVAARWDIQSGNGVYKSTDGGEHWQHVGLTESERPGHGAGGRTGPLLRAQPCTRRVPLQRWRQDLEADVVHQRRHRRGRHGT